MKADFPHVIAHRGASAYAPENTFAAMNKAAELNIPWVEFDVVLTADDVPIVFHDDTLKRTTNGKGKIAQKSFAEIAELDAGSWFAPSFKGEPVPRFDALLDHLAKLDLAINVEIKPTEGREIATARAVVKTLQEHWTGRQDKLLISSFAINALQEVRKLDGSLPLGLLVKKWFKGWHEYLHDLKCVSLNANYKILSSKIVAQLREEGILVLAYTVDSPKKAQQLFKWGVNAVFSNVPDKIESRNG